MVNNKDLLLQLSPFSNHQNIIIDDQSVGDIIGAILDTHKQYKNEYDKIYMYFVGTNPKETAKNVFNYLKKNVKYNIEPEDLQTVKSPAAIIATGNIGSDCKNYALFANGILDAYRRNELQNFDLYYRFASYELTDNTPQHVFAVMVSDGQEIWIDPVLSFFNQQKKPYFYTDKKIKDMALMALSGVHDPYENYYHNATIGDATTQFLSAGAATASNAILPGSGLITGALVSLVSSLFPSGGGTTSDYLGWDALDDHYNMGVHGTSPAAHIVTINNGTDKNPKLAMQNILSWIQSHGNNAFNLLFQTFHTGHDLDGQTVTINDLVNAMNKTGYSSQAQQLYSYYQQIIAQNPVSSTSTTGGGISPIVLIGGAALLFFSLK